jgi:hypothetical protein
MRIQSVFLALLLNNRMASDSVKRSSLASISLLVFLKGVLAGLSFWLSASAIVVPSQYSL